MFALLAATIAALGNAGVTWLNGELQRQLERERAADNRNLEENKSEAARVLEMIKTNDPDKAAINLNFLVEAHLISDPKRAELQKYLQERKPGQGPALPAAQGGALSSTPSLDTDLSKLHPVFRNALVATLRQLANEGLKFRLIEGYRSPERQNLLNEQGVTRARPWQGLHEFGLAADLVVFDNGNWNWNASSDTYRRMHEVARAHGLAVPSASVGFSDPNHVAMEGVKLDDLRRGVYPPGGDDSWRENLRTAISSWSGKPAAPPGP
jgi:hypothetical protein